MDKTEYTQEVNNMLADDTTYQKLKNDPTSAYQTKINKVIDKLKEQDCITEDKAKKLKTLSYTT